MKATFMQKYLIKNVWIYDGTGTRPFLSDLLIEDIKIKKIQKRIKIDADEEIDGKGRTFGCCRILCD